MIAENPNCGILTFSVRWALVLLSLPAALPLVTCSMRMVVLCGTMEPTSWSLGRCFSSEAIPRKKPADPS